MFEFNRGGTKYIIKYGDGLDDNFIICSFYDKEQDRYRWVSMMDLFDLESPILKYNGDEIKFLQDFIDKINKALDDFFGTPEIPPSDATPKERLTYAVQTKLSFNEQTQHLELK